MFELRHQLWPKNMNSCTERHDNRLLQRVNRQRWEESACQRMIISQELVGTLVTCSVFSAKARPATTAKPGHGQPAPCPCSTATHCKDWSCTPEDTTISHTRTSIITTQWNSKICATVCGWARRSGSNDVRCNEEVATTWTATATRGLRKTRGL